MFLVVTSTPSPNASRPTVQSPKITSFSSWLDAWNTYIATIVAHNSDRASEILGYQRLIHSASKHFSTSTWLKYDAQFRTLAVSNPQLRWDLRHSELRLDSLAIQTDSSGLVGHAHIVAAHTISRTGALVVPFVQANKILASVLHSEVLDLLSPSEILNQDLSPAETSTTALAIATPVGTSTTVTSVVPHFILPIGATGSHLLHPTEPSGPRSRTPL